MKKSLICLLLLSFMFCIENKAFSEDVQTKTVSDIQEAKAQEPELNVVSESGNIQILKQGDKYAVYNKETKSFIIKPIVDEISLFSESKPNLYKIIISGKIGFINVDNDTKVLTQFSDITLLDEFLKFKKEDKYGLMSLNSDVIIPALYDKINILNQGGQKLISAKSGNKYKMFTLAGKEIPEEELYSVNITDSDYSDLIKDLKQEIKDYLIAKKLEQRNEDANLIGKNVKTAQVEKNVHEAVAKTYVDDTPAETSEVNYGNLQFFALKKNNKIGLTSIFGEEIAPMIFDKIDIDTPCKHFKEPIVIGKNDNKTSIYNLDGKELANMSNNVANVFWHRKTYTYTQVSDRIWDVKVKNKQIGKLVKLDGTNKYKFKKTGFSILSMHKVNELFINLLSA